MFVESYYYEKQDIIDHLPEGHILIQSLNNKDVHLHALCLYDSGSTSTLINQRAVPPTIIAKIGTAQSFTTTQGSYKSSKYFMANNIFFPDFCRARRIPEIVMRLFNSPMSRYDVIISRDVLRYEFVLDHARHTVTWDGLTIEMTRAATQTNPTSTSFTCSFSAEQIYANEKTKILHAKYDKALPTDVVQTCTHLSSQNQTKLLQVISKFPQLFSGALGRYVHKKFSICLKDPNVTPVFCNPYPIPLVHQQVFQKEL